MEQLKQRDKPPKTKRKFCPKSVWSRKRNTSFITKLSKHRFKFRVQRADEESRSHVENDKAYEKASNFGNVLGKKTVQENTRDL